jgi:hypothetical protein
VSLNFSAFSGLVLGFGLFQLSPKSIFLQSNPLWIQLNLG